MTPEKVINCFKRAGITSEEDTEDDILEQFQTCQVESDKDDNDSDGKTVNNVAPELPSRRAAESVLDAFKNAALYGTTEDECRVFF